MHKKNICRAATSVVIISALSFGGISAGNAATSSLSVSAPASSSVVLTGTVGAVGSASTVSPSSLGSFGGTLSSAPVTAAGGGASTQAVPVFIRVAIRAGMEVLKRTSTTWYNAIRSAINSGRTAFVNFWNNNVPSSIKTIVYGATGGVGVNALYDALLWVFGLN